MNSKVYSGDLYTIVHFDYFGEPSCDEYVYLTKEAAQKAIQEIGPTNITYVAMPLDEYHYELRQYHVH